MREIAPIKMLSIYYLVDMFPMGFVYMLGEEEINM